MLILLLHFAIISWLSWRLYGQYAGSSLRLYFWPALLLKLIAGILLGLLYFFYYGSGDTLLYHEDASTLASLAWQDPLNYFAALAGSYPEGIALHYLEQERALFAAKIFSFFYVFTGSNYWLSACYLSFLAFAALFRLVYRLARYRPGLQRPAALAFLFWPSFVFWTSGLLKESISMICIAFILATFLPYLLRNVRASLWEVAGAVLLFLLLFYLKYYYAAILGPVLGCLLLAVWLGRRFRVQKPLVWLLFFFSLIGGVAFAMQLHPNLGTERFLRIWVENYYLMKEISDPNAYVAFEGLKADWQSILRHAPEAIAAGLFAPLFQFDATNMLRLLACAENVLLLLLSIGGLMGWALQQRGRLSLYLLALLIYILAFALIISIAAPNYGALLRYRVSYHPFFVFLMMSGCFQLISWLREKRAESLIKSMPVEDNGQ